MCCNKYSLSFWHAAELVLNIPVISLPYIKMGFIVWSYICNRVEILGLEDDKDLCNLNTAFSDFLYNSSFPCLKSPLDINFKPKYL